MIRLFFTHLPKIRTQDKRAQLKGIILISQPKHVVGTQKNHLEETVFEHPKRMFYLIYKKILTILN